MLVPINKKESMQDPLRPDSGLYMDIADCDGDGDLDLVVGGYTHMPNMGDAPNGDARTSCVWLFANKSAAPAASKGN